MNVPALQAALRERNIDAWLLYDFRHMNPIANRIAGIAEDRHTTRRWFGLVPAEGEPRWLHSAIEAHVFADLPGTKTAFVGWRDLEASLGTMLAGRRLPARRPATSATANMLRESGAMDSPASRALYSSTICR